MNKKLLFVFLSTTLIFILYPSYILYSSQDHAHSEVTIQLKTGVTFKGEVIKRTNEYIKINFHGNPLTFYSDEIENVIHKPPVSAFDYLKKGIECASEGKFKEAEEEFKIGVGIDKFDHDLQEALRVMNDLNKGTINENYAFYLFKGANYLINGQYQQGIVEFHKALQINPNYAEAYFSLGVAHGFLGDTQQAISYFRKTLQIAPNSIKTYFSLSFAYGSLGQHQQAIICLQKVLQIDPNYAEAYIALGLARYSLGQYREAKESFLKAKELFQSKKDYQNVKKMEEYINKVP